MAKLDNLLQKVGKVSEKLQNHNGRTTIEDPRRRNWSKRAADGKIIVEKGNCHSCGHHKKITNMSANSNNFGRSKCSRCGVKL